MLLQEAMQSNRADVLARKDHEHALPPEILSSVFAGMQLKDLVPFRTVSSSWKELVDIEARLRFLRLTGDECSPFVLQAGPPALFDVCEFLGLDFAGYSTPKSCISRTYPAILGTLCVSHQDHNPYHCTTMSEDDSKFFENIILSITRVERRMSQDSSMSRQMAFRGLTNWEVARETDRVWREWWDNAPYSNPGSPSQSRSASPANDSGFAEGPLLTGTSEYIDAKEASSESVPPEACLKALDIGSMIHRATMDVSITDDEFKQHQYRWTSVELDVYRTLLTFEERVSRSGLRAMVSPARMYVL